MEITPLGGEARTYLEESLRDGLSFSRALAACVAGRTVSAATAAALDPAHAQRFAEGGLGGGGVSDAFGDLLAQRWPDAYLVVETLARPSDPFVVTSGRRDLVTCGDEVYSVAALAAGPESRVRTLHATDSSSVYAAAVVTTTNGAPPRCPPEDRHEGRLTIHCLATGAYDGEGYVFCALDA